VEPGFEKIVVSPRRRRTSSVASRTVAAGAPPFPDPAEPLASRAVAVVPACSPPAMDP
jgi:hypothetical protein